MTGSDGKDDHWTVDVDDANARRIFDCAR